MTTIKIDEFSTGIKAAGNIENWYSQGFTGEYMNRTIAEIPSAVQKAISNRLFAVAEGGSSEQATLIGREVKDDQQEKAWSVLAVVTRGRDEWQRPFSAHRYFICDGRGNLANLFKFWFEDKSIFNPFEIKNLGDTIDYVPGTGGINPQQLSDSHKAFLQQKAPIIFPHDAVMPPMIADCIATVKAEEDGDLVSWAYQVEALEHPRTFKAIFPASKQAEQILRRVVASQPQVERFVQDEPAIKKAISLLSQNKVKPEHLKTIEDALNNPVIDEKYWLTMFDSQGAGDALKQGNYGHSMIRLLTLQAMMLPRTFLLFLDWLVAREKTTEHYDISGDFQSKIAKYDLSYCPKLTERLYEGVVLIIPEILRNPKILRPLAWILKDRSGCWGAIYQTKVWQILGEDLGHLKKCARNRKYENLSFMKYEEWKYIYNDIVSCWIYGRSNKIKKYEVLAKLFEEIGSYQAAALFYYVSIGCVPSDIFSIIKQPIGFGNSINIELYGLTVKKKLNLAEKFWYTDLRIGDKTMRLPYFTLIFFVCYIIGWFGGFLANKYIFSDAEKSMNVASRHLSSELKKGDNGQKNVRKTLIAFFQEGELSKSENKDLSDALACVIDPKSAVKLCDMSQQKFQEALSKLSETQKNLKEARSNIMNIKEVTTDVKYTEASANEYIANQIGVSAGNINGLIIGGLTPEEQRKMIYRIYKYQDQNQIIPTGILDKTTQEKILKPIKPVESPK